MKNIYNFLGLHVFPYLIRLYLKTIRFEIQNEPKENNNYIYIFWHSKMLTGWYLFRKKKASALVSKSKDGDILNNILEKWNYKVIRGSSSKGGKEAIEKLIELTNMGYNAVITPDGPRGPALKIKNGPLIISNKCGIPIIPVKIYYEKKSVLSKSWDKFEIPMPFSKCTVTFGKEFSYNEYLYEEELKHFKDKLSEELS